MDEIVEKPMSPFRRKIMWVLPFVLGAVLLSTVEFLADNSRFYLILGMYGGFLLCMFISPNRMFDRPLKAYASKAEFWNALFDKAHYLRYAIGLSVLAAGYLLFYNFAYSNALNSHPIGSSEMTAAVLLLLVYSFLLWGASYFLLKWMGEIKR